VRRKSYTSPFRATFVKLSQNHSWEVYLVTTQGILRKLPFQTGALLFLNIITIFSLTRDRLTTSFTTGDGSSAADLRRMQKRSYAAEQVTGWERAALALR